ncbi:MAG: hypothetical protein PHW69_05145 [Elusimicrobiaceae bacterium]|nr:hypothetical protein [Elusimicrobiaceae bacterium]
METWVLANLSMLVFGLVIAGLIGFDVYRRMKAEGRQAEFTAGGPEAASVPAKFPLAGPDKTDGVAHSSSPLPLLGELPMDTESSEPVGVDIGGCAGAVKPGNIPNTVQTDSIQASLSGLGAALAKYRNKPGVAEVLAELKKRGIDLSAPKMDFRAVMAAYADPKFQKTIASAMSKPKAKATFLSMAKDPQVMAALGQLKGVTQSKYDSGVAGKKSAQAVAPPSAGLRSAGGTAAVLNAEAQAAQAAASGGPIK